MVSMRFLQVADGKVSMAATGAVLAYYGSPWLAEFLGIPEGLSGFLCGFLGMAVMSRLWQAVGRRPSGRCGRRCSSEFEAAKGCDMESTIYITLWAVLAFVSWLIVAGGAALAVFSKSIEDSALERIGLSAVCLTTTGAACRIVAAGWASAGDAALAVSAAVYVAAVTIKHIREPKQ